jgi:hypothetical protein
MRVEDVDYLWETPWLSGSTEGPQPALCFEDNRHRNSLESPRPALCCEDNRHRNRLEGHRPALCCEDNHHRNRLESPRPARGFCEGYPRSLRSLG